MLNVFLLVCKNSLHINAITIWSVLYVVDIFSELVI